MTSSALIEAATASRERVAELETRVGVLEGDLQRARQGRDIASASKQEARENLRQARDALDEEQARFRSYMGPTVSDGPHVGRLIAVGADQSPARVTRTRPVVHGAAATQAAIEDGAIAAGDTGRRYFRNDRPSGARAGRHVRHRHGTRWGGADLTIALEELQRDAATPGAPSASRTIRSGSPSSTEGHGPHPAPLSLNVSREAHLEPGAPAGRVEDGHVCVVGVRDLLDDREAQALPPESRSRASSSRSKRSKTRLRSIGGMPAPSSSTVRITSSSVARSPRVTVVSE